MVKSEEDLRRGANPLLLQPVEILDVRRETPDVQTYTLRLVDGSRFFFQPGQFNMVSVIGIGEAAISMSSDPKGAEALAEGVFQHTIRIVGNVTRALARLRTGDRFWIRGPYGNGWPLEQATGDLVIIAGGVGLAPLRPAIYRRLARHSGRLEILYGARTPGDMLFRDEFPSWQEGGARLRLTADKVSDGAEWPYRVGLVTALLDEVEIAPGQGQVFICGPEVMMKAVVRSLSKLGWPPEEIFVSLERRMECGQKTCGRCQIDDVYVCQDGPVFSYAAVKDLLGVDL
ncbi:MAG: FAD/NAD(P)-binding protein [Thermacetogeniaceae bacterium]